MGQNLVDQSLHLFDGGLDLGIGDIGHGQVGLTQRIVGLGLGLPDAVVQGADGRRGILGKVRVDLDLVDMLPESHQMA